MGWALRQFFKLWVRAAVQPAEAPPSLTTPDKPVCYVFDRDSTADLAVLCNVTDRRKLPYPEKRSASLPVEQRRSYFDVGRRRRFWDASITRRPPPYLLELVEELRDDSLRDVLLVPTAVYWGRAPQKEGSWLRLLFAENWALTTRVHKFFSVLVNGRNVMVEMGDPISLRSMLDATPASDQARRITRVLRGILRRQRGTRIGPDLSHRRTIVAQVLRARAVRAVVASEAREKHDKYRPGLLQARKYAFEIAANYSHPFVQFAEKLLGHGPNDIFPSALDDGLLPVGPMSRVENFETGGTDLFILGADGTLGRDEFLRILYGGRVSLQVAVISTLIIMLIGVTTGAIAGYYRGWADTIVSRLTEITMAFPALLFAIALASTAGTQLNGVTLGGLVGEGVVTLVLVFTVFGWFYPARIIRAKVLSLREKEFVEAALMTGASDTRIIRSHLLPHLVAPIIVYSTLIVAAFVLSEAALSFLGVGIQPPTASWGNLLADAPNFYTTVPLLMLWPGLALVFTTLAFNLLGDGLRDAFDPRSRI